MVLQVPQKLGTLAIRKCFFSTLGHVLIFDFVFGGKTGISFQINFHQSKVFLRPEASRLWRLIPLSPCCLQFSQVVLGQSGEHFIESIWWTFEEPIWWTLEESIWWTFKTRTKWVHQVLPPPFFWNWFWLGCWNVCITFRTRFVLEKRTRRCTTVLCGWWVNGQWVSG